jgi:hypothetical protein
MGGYIDKIAGFFDPREQEAVRLKKAPEDWGVAYGGAIPAGWKEPQNIMRDLLDAQAKCMPRTESEISAALAHPDPNIVELAGMTHALHGDQLTALFVRCVTEKYRLLLEDLLQAQARKGVDSATMIHARQRAEVVLKNEGLSNTERRQRLDSMMKMDIKELVGSLGKDTEIEFRIERSDEFNKPVRGSFHVTQSPHERPIDYLWYHDESTGYSSIMIRSSNPKDGTAQEFLKVNKTHLEALVNEYVASVDEQREFRLR